MQTRAPARTSNLADCFEEVLTAICRLRARSQAIASAEAFREQILLAIRAAGQSAAGTYSREEVRSATFALVAFLDESVLNSGDPVLSNWTRKPLQEEMFGVHTAGEIFFENLKKLLAEPDSPRLADLLEIYHLCLLLGFRGRYSVGNPGELYELTRAAGESVLRTRGARGPFAPGWNPPQETVAASADPWVRILGYAAAACAVLAAILFFSFQWLLSAARQGS